MVSAGRKIGKPIASGRVVAELQFGFWTSLLDVRYERKLWQRILKSAFPYMPGRIRTRHFLSGRFQNLRRLRNRVFHHEPLWNWPNLMQRHNEAREALGWMCPEFRDLTDAIDRFPTVYNQGIPHYKQHLQAFLTARGHNY